MTCLVKLVMVASSVALCGASYAELPGATPLARLTVSTPAHDAGQSATLLPDSRWLLVGGLFDGKPSGALILRGSSSSSPAPALPATLAHPRTNHTATVLPDGTVLIFGGTGPDGAVVAEAELFDPQAKTLETLPDTGLTPRTRHTATLLTDGLVLIAGGLDRSGTPDQVSELYNPKTRKAEPLTASLLTGRADHQAALLANGKGLVWGGKDAAGQQLANGELYDPAATRFNGVESADDSALPARNLTETAPQIADSLPQAKASDVPVDSRVAVRFTEPLNVQTVTAASVTLVGPGGAVGGKVVAAEGGMLAFFTPSADLSPATTYTLFLNGLADTASRPLPFSSFSFTTHRFQADAFSPSQSGVHIKIENLVDAADAGKARIHGGNTIALLSGNRPQQPSQEGDKKKPEEDDGTEDWLPSEPNRHGNWQVLGLPQDPVLHFHRLTLAQIGPPAGATALTGRVARLNGKPLPGVPVSIGSHAAITDADGRFVLAGLPDGAQALKVDGAAVSSGGRHYAKHFIHVDLKRGQTTSIPDTIYLVRVDPASEIAIASPMDKELVLTHPAMPGLEVHIPKRAVLREYDGKIVTKLSITPIPVDRAPYPAPVKFSVYFTLQPGGAFLDGDPGMTVKIVYPNYDGFAPGTPVDFWNYDPSGGGWKVYGRGLVSMDGKRVIPDRALGFRQVMTFGIGITGSGGKTPAATGPRQCGKNKGDPVDCFTGLFTHTVTDIAIPDVMPISVTRTYRQNDGIARAFGIGADLSYGMYLYTTYSGDAPSVVDVVFADSSRMHFYYQSGSISGHSAVWTNTDSPTAFHGAVLQVDPSQNLFRLTLADGTVLTFGTHPYNLLQSITDRNGNTVTITSSGNNITQVTSPNGRYIQFGYDSSNRITTATDNLGRIVTYSYNAPNCPGCLWKVTDMDQNTEQYGYTDSNDYTRLTTVTDKRNNLVTTNTYDPGTGRVTRQTLADNTYWQFGYGQDGSGNPQTTITDPRGTVEVETFNASGYVTKDVLAQGQPEQQTYTYQRDSTTNLVQQLTDTIGRVTKYNYDSYGDVTSVTRLYGTSSAETDSFTYDPTFRQLTSHTDGNNNTTTFNIDGNGNLYSVVDALNNITQITVNGQGLPTQVTDPLNHSTQLGYQQADLASITDALGRKASIFTDGAGRPMGVTDPLGFRTLYSYDNMNRLLQVTDPQNGVTAMAYDPNGNLHTVTDPRNIGTHTYAYDTRNRLYTYTDPLNAVETYLYDGLDNLTQYTDRKNQVTRYQYDGLNRPTLITYNDGATVQISYYPGRDEPQQAVDSANGTVSWQFDLLGRLIQETTPQGTVSYPLYDSGDRLRQMVVNSGATIAYGYDNANRLRSITQGSASVSITPDNAGRRQSVTLPNGVTMTYGYDDPGDDLQSITYANGGTSLGQITYAYDNAGRRISRNSTLDNSGLPNPVSLARYDAANRLVQWGNQTLSYDANGNLLNDGANNYSWNARDQLASLSGGTSAYFAYDAMGRRQSRTVGGTGTSFLYSGVNLVNEQTALGSASYLTGGIDETFSRTDSGGTQSYLTDALGSTVGLSNSAGATVTGYTYDAYGNTTTSGTASANALQYAGRENDGTGLYFNRARYYSPGLGRFISQDPLGLGGGLNTYAYVDGDPISFYDPYGLYSSGDFLNDASDFSAGWGDTLSFGLTAQARKITGGSVNVCSNFYLGGQIFGVANDVLIGGAAGFEASGSRVAGKEFSHWIPARYFRPSSPSYKPWLPIWLNGPLNGKFVSPWRHFKHDPFRYPKGWRDWGDKWNPVLQQLDRIPDWLAGGAVGGALGTASAASQGCGCSN